MNKLPHILMLHNRYQYAGGEDVATETDVNLLRQFGHEVTLWELHNDRIKDFSPLDMADLFVKTTWNHQIYEQTRSQLQAIRPDILHVQNFFPLFSPSVHAAAKSLGIPTIQHLHNFRLGCLNGYLLRNNLVCEVCVGKNPWRGVWHRCYRNSLLSSLAVWSMVTGNRWRRTWWRDVDAFITPSLFAAEKLAQIGIIRERIHIKASVIEDYRTSHFPLPDPPIFLYVGRLSPEKGIMTLLQAWQQLNQPTWQLQIIGDGDQKADLQNFVRGGTHTRLGNRNLTNVHFFGHLPMSEVTAAMQRATAIAVPSQWYETFGRVVVEAFACERGVLASNIGALSELVQEGHNGFLIPCDRIDSWVERLQWAGDHPHEMTQIGQKARQDYDLIHTPKANYDRLNKIYQSIH
jgi:glycosyltransferase involved in cell wall biosynthesis